MTAADLKRYNAALQEKRKLAARYAEVFRDFRSFCAMLQYVDFETGERHAMRLTRIQKRYCKARTKRDIILKARKVFMTSLEVAYDLWWFFTKPGHHVVIVVQSDKEGQAKNVVAGMVRVYLESLRRFMPIELTQETAFDLKLGDSQLHIMEAGASMRTATKGGRATKAHRLHLTEAAFYEHAEETLTSLLGAMPKHGDTSVVIESTPNGAAGFYHDTWKRAVEGKGYKPHFFAWTDDTKNAYALAMGEVFEPADERERALVAKGVTFQQLKWYRAQVDESGNPDKIRQEYPDDPVTCFLTSGRMFFDGDRTQLLIAHATNTRPMERRTIRRAGAYGELRIYHSYDPRREYVLSGDTSEGTGGDEGAGIVRERGTARLMAVLQGQFKPHELGVELGALGEEYGWAELAVERNNHGSAVLEALVWTVKYPNLWHDHDGKLGWITHQVSRSTALSALEQSHRAGVWVSYDGGNVEGDIWRQTGTLAQFWTFVVNKNGKPEAGPGAHDDLVMGEAICWDVLRRPVQHRDLTNLAPA